MEYYSFESVLMRWMKLEPVIQSEVSQKERQQYSILTHIYMKFTKMVMATLCVRRQKRHRDNGQTFGLCGRRPGWDDFIEQHWNIYITICEIDDQSKSDAWNRALKAGALGQPRGMELGGDRRGLWARGHMYTCGWFMSMYGKNNHNIVISLQIK